MVLWVLMLWYALRFFLLKITYIYIYIYVCDYEMILNI